MKVVSSCICVLTDRLVFNGGAGHAEIQFAVLLYAGVDQSLHGAFILEQQEGVACIKHSRVIGADQATKKLTVFLEFNVLIIVITLLLFCCSKKKIQETLQIWLTKTEPQLY